MAAELPQNRQPLSPQHDPDISFQCLFTHLPPRSLLLQEFYLACLVPSPLALHPTFSTYRARWSFAHPFVVYEPFLVSRCDAGGWGHPRGEMCPLIVHCLPRAFNKLHMSIQVHMQNGETVELHPSTLTRLPVLQGSKSGVTDRESNTLDKSYTWISVLPI
jgi:hypothetical protein